MDKDLKKIIKNFSSSVLYIGNDDEISKYLEKNENITSLDVLSNKKSTSKAKRKIFKKNKTVNINKLRKRYKNKSIDYIICDYNIILPYIRKFIKSSVFISKNKIYFYGDVDLSIINKYKRYNCNINIINNKKNKIIEIDNINFKTNIFKNILYLIYDIADFFIYLVELIGDILMG